MTDRIKLAAKIRAKLEAVIDPDGPQTLSNYVTDEVKMARALLVAMKHFDNADEQAIEGVARELWLLEVVE